MWSGAEGTKGCEDGRARPTRQKLTFFWEWTGVDRTDKVDKVDKVDNPEANKAAKAVKTTKLPTT